MIVKNDFCYAGGPKKWWSDSHWSAFYGMRDSGFREMAMAIKFRDLETRYRQIRSVRYNYSDVLPWGPGECEDSDFDDKTKKQLKVIYKYCKASYERS